MSKGNGKKEYCCYVAEMLEGLGVTRHNVIETKKVVLRAVKALVEAEIEHMEAIEQRAAGRRSARRPAARRRSNGNSTDHGPFSVPLSSFEKRRRAP